jgi:hypothetical protein
MGKTFAARMLCRVSSQASLENWVQFQIGGRLPWEGFGYGVESPERSLNSRCSSKSMSHLTGWCRVPSFQRIGSIPRGCEFPSSLARHLGIWNDLQRRGAQTSGEKNQCRHPVSSQVRWLWFAHLQAFPSLFLGSAGWAGGLGYEFKKYAWRKFRPSLPNHQSFPRCQMSRRSIRRAITAFVALSHLR